MEVNPELENLKGLVRVDIGVHGHSVSCEYNSIRRKMTEGEDHAAVARCPEDMPDTGG
jgi:hypothetical protein